jgi:hypothetical protein
MRWWAFSAHGNIKYAYKILVGKFESKSWENHIKMTLKKEDVKAWAGFNSLRIRPVTGCCERETFGFHERREISKPAGSCHLLKKDYAACSILHI